ncbi:hypothetical protein GJ496_007334 [Pomphorhynchus laevis]|nr:hypothetical protein GJ496_007334 [Pomphorhynchus laevis]
MASIKVPPDDNVDKLRSRQAYLSKFINDRTRETLIMTSDSFNALRLFASLDDIRRPLLDKELRTSTVVHPAYDDTNSPSIKLLNLIEMTSSSLIYDDQKQHLESIQTCQRNDIGFGAGLNIAALCRRHLRMHSISGELWLPYFNWSPDLTSGLVYFKDSFDGDGPLKEWVIPSKPDKPQGKFVVATKKYSNESKSIRLKTTENARFYWMSKRFATHASTEDHDLIVQFSVAFEQSIDCGGGYVKLFRSETSKETLTDSTPYYIMFGPDISGLQKRIVHVIINHNGTNSNCKSSPKCKDDVFTHVYTLHLYASNRSYEVRIDNESVQSGNLTDDLPIPQPREITYPSDAKPSNWDDRERIADPTTNFRR